MCAFVNSTSESVSGPMVTLVVSFTWTKAFQNSVVLSLFNKFSSIFLKTLPKVIHSVISLISEKKILNQAWLQCIRPADFEKILITLRRGSFSFNLNTFEILYMPGFIFWCKSKQVSYHESLNEQTKRGSGFLFSSYSTFLTVSLYSYPRPLPTWSWNRGLHPLSKKWPFFCGSLRVKNSLTRSVFRD